MLMLVFLPWRDCSKPLLSGRVPDLQLDGFAVELDRADLEVHADSADVALGVGVVGEPEQEARLPNAGVADQ